jgi:hypothetical protein
MAEFDPDEERIRDNIRYFEEEARGYEEARRRAEAQVGVWKAKLLSYQTTRGALGDR